MRSNSRRSEPQRVSWGAERSMLLRALVEETRAVRSLLAWVPLWGFLASLLAGVVANYQIPRTYSVDVGSPRDEAYVRNFHGRLSDGSNAYRWSDVYGYVLFPGLGGSRPFTVTLQLDPVRKAKVTVIVNGMTGFEGSLEPGWQEAKVKVDAVTPSALNSRDTVVEIRAPEYRTEEAPGERKGLKVGRVTVEQASSGGLIVPSYSLVVLSLIAALLVYLFVGRALWGFATLARARLWGSLAAVLSGLGILRWSFADHVALAAAAPHLVITTATMLTLLVAGDRLAGAHVLTARVGKMAPRLLAFSMAVAFGLRYGGMALPQSVIIDMPWHMKWLETLLTGNWQALYFPSADGLSSVPKEWGLNVLIPKSPLFYFAAAPLSLLPFDLETTVKWAVCMMDASLVAAGYWFVRRLGGSREAGLWAAALYTVMPLAFRAFAYGILPTIFAQWLAVLLFAWVLAIGYRPWRLPEWLGLGVLVTLTLLAFPTVAAFTTIVLLGFAFAGALSSGSSAARSISAWHILLLLVAGWALAIFAYYGLYVSPVLTSISAMLTPKPGGGATVKWPGGFPELVAWTAGYVVSVLPLILSVFGIVFAYCRVTANRERMHAFWLVAGWASIVPLFLLVNYRVDMIGKHLFFTMIPVAVLGGTSLWLLARRGRASGVLAALALALVTWQGLIFWIDRLIRASS